MGKNKFLNNVAKVTLSTLLSASAVTMLSANAGFAPVTDADIANDAKTVEDVVTYGLGQKGQRYSSLDQINKKSIKDLVPVWNFSFGGEKQRGQEAQPLVKDGVMYVTASYSRMYAIDIATGDELWQYDARLPGAILPVVM